MRGILQEAAAGAHVLRTQILRSDNGTEFLNSEVQEILAQAGIRHERTCPNTSHQNGVAERAIGRLMTMVRTMMAAASARPTLWGEAIHAAAHIINRIPSSSNLDNVSPFKIRFGRVPSIGHLLQPWGITAYVWRFSQQTNLQQRADPGMLVGYAHELTHQKGWRVYVPFFRRVITSPNVTFDINIEESLQRRHASLRSVDLPEEEDLLQPAQQTAIPPHDTSSSESASTAESVSPHPLCTRGAAAPPIVPSTVIPSSESPSLVPPQAASATRPITRSTSTWSDVVRKTDKNIQEANATGPPFSRPRGRPPANHKWDATKGEYVPIHTLVVAPAANTAWILDAMNSDLVANHATPKSYPEAVNVPRFRALETGDTRRTSIA